MSARKDRSQPRVRLFLEQLEDRLPVGNLLPYLSLVPFIDGFATGAIETVPYQLVWGSDNETNSTLKSEATLVLDNADDADSYDVFKLLASRTEALDKNGTLVANTHDPFAAEAASEQQFVSHEESDPLPNPVEAAKHTEPILSTPATNTPQNLAGAYAGAGQGPGGASTTNPIGGGSASDGGTANLYLPTQTQLQQMLSGSNGTANAASPVAAPAPVASAPQLHHQITLSPPVTAETHLPHAEDAGIVVDPASSPLSGGPAISATEGVQWTGQVATITDSDGDSNNYGYETINYTVNWGDNTTSSFSVAVPEGGSAGALAGHGWQEMGTYTVTISATDSDGGTSSASDTATVSDAPLNWVQGINAPGYPPAWGQSFEPTPSITTPPNQTNNEGDQVSLQVQASDGGFPVSYDAVGLPPGLSINSSTGLISGTVA